MENKKGQTIEPWKKEKFKENSVGIYLRENREMRGYSQLEVCEGICSESTLSRIELGGKAVDFQMVETFISRMGIEKSEYEFFLAGNSAAAYQHREKIKILYEKGKYEEVEKSLDSYEEKYIKGNKGNINNQFLYFRRAMLEQLKPQPDLKKLRELLLKARSITVKDYQKRIEEKALLSDMELECIIELIHCIENPEEEREKYEEFYSYFKWNLGREKSFPVPYRKLLKYYAKCLYKMKEFDLCIQICTEMIEEIYNTSKEDNRWELFYLRSKARKEKGMTQEEEKILAQTDFMVAHSLLCYLKDKTELTENDMMGEWDAKL